MENNEQKAVEAKSESKMKIKVSPEQVQKACEKMGETANAVDNIYDNLKGKMGPLGKAVGFGVLVTFALALIHSPGLVWVLVLAVLAGCAPMIHSKVMELKAAGEKKEVAKVEDNK